MRPRAGASRTGRVSTTMRIIFIMIDTLRFDHLKMGGAKLNYAPEIDQLAANASFFDHQYVSSFPTVPNREDIMTGKFSFPHHGWGPFPADETAAAEIFQDGGYLTQMICDTPHLLGRGHGYHRGFDAYHWIRGNECDTYLTKYNTPPPHTMPRELTRIDEEYFGAHLADLQTWNNPQVNHEEGTFVARTARTASRWIEENYKCEDFFLWLDTFELHEPYIPPTYLKERYGDPKYKGPDITYPRYGSADPYTKAEIKNMQALYAGEVTLISKWIGHILRKLEDCGIYDDTFVAITSDHGTYNGEHNRMGKILCGGPKRNKFEPWIQYDEVNRIPLVIKLPRQKKGQRIRQLVQPVDYLPTLLDLGGVKTDLAFEGESLRPLLEGKKVKWDRKQAYSSNSISSKNPNFWTAINTAKWQLHIGGDADDKPILFDRQQDPRSMKNIAGRNPKVVQRMGREYVRFLRDHGTEEAKVVLMESKL